MTELKFRGVRAMSPADLVAFTVMTLEKLVGVDVGKKYNPNQPRGGSGKWVATGSHGGGGGGEHGGGGDEEEAGGGGHGGVSHVGSHTSSGSHGGGSEGSGGGVEKGSVYVGSKDSVGETVTHPQHGTGTVTAVDSKAGTATVQYQDGTKRTYATAVAPQSAKLVPTGSEQNKTHIANVKVGKGGVVTNKDDGKKVGTVGQATNGTHYYQHTASGEMQGGFSSKHTAVKGLVEEHNKQANKAPTEAAKPKPAEEVKTYENVGAVSGHDMAFEGDADSVTGVKLKDATSGTVIGSAQKVDSKYYVGTHADGSLFHEASETDAIESVINHHNATYGAPKTETSAESKPAEGSKDYEKIGTVSGDNLSLGGDVNDASDPLHVVDPASGVKIGDVSKVDEGYYTAEHADGTVFHEADETDAVMAVLNHHNAKYGGTTPASTSTESTPAKEVKPAPGYHKAGTAVTAADITVKKDGTAVHKPTGEVLGTVEKNGHGGWASSHANGSNVTANSYTKKDAVGKLANVHNKKVALESSVESDKSTEWSKDAPKADYSNTDLKPLDGASSAHASSHVELTDANGNKIGEIEKSSDGGYDVTHVSGASYHTSDPSKYGAQSSLTSFHNQAVERAEGKAPEKPEPVAPKPTEAYEKAGNVSAGGLKSANVQKDADGKITGSDVTNSAGDKIGYTKANADGTMDVYHADGTLVLPSAKPGTGGATQALANHQNLKYGKSTPAATATYFGGGSKTESTPEPGKAGKFEPTDASKAEGGLHNNPEKSYDPTGGSVSATKTLYDQPGAKDLGMSAAEKSAIKSYTGSGYHAMNTALRTGNSDATTNKKIDDLDKAFLKTPELQTSIVTYRGINSQAGQKLLGDVGSHVGKTFTEPAYSSTAAQSSNAFSGGVKFRVTSPPGSHVLRPNGHGHYGDSESEILLPRGTQFKVMRDEMVNGTRQVDVVVVGSSMQ